jgi:hypothetical protein
VCQDCQAEDKTVRYSLADLLPYARELSPQYWALVVRAAAFIVAHELRMTKGELAAAMGVTRRALMPASLKESTALRWIARIEQIRSEKKRPGIPEQPPLHNI